MADADPTTACATLSLSHTLSHSHFSLSPLLLLSIIENMEIIREEGRAVALQAQGSYFFSSLFSKFSTINFYNNIPLYHYLFQPDSPYILTIAIQSQ